MHLLPSFHFTITPKMPPALSKDAPYLLKPQYRKLHKPPENINLSPQEKFKVGKRDRPYGLVPSVLRFPCIQTVHDGLGSYTRTVEVFNRASPRKNNEVLFLPSFSFHQPSLVLITALSLTVRTQGISMIVRSVPISLFIWLTSFSR